MEIENSGEQPFKLDKTQEEMKEILEERGGQTQVDTGSPIGKFNSPESLLEAYNNLQREFTKKCQRLSELEKVVEKHKKQQEAEEEYEELKKNM